ncbi:HEXXH motif domain-containing protein [Nocardia brevicatena]|uniref:HEXXH motif domain-containing protein n=1 Tax=Nocardia brevicatena TaxID=37327 RepID=UPI00059532D8|nr:HEXXH motif domain-containing protein [Nocardia brevicatena]
MTTNIVVEIDDVVADLASGQGTEQSIETLTRGLLTTRMILLRTLMTEMMTRMPESAAAARLPDAYQNLTELQRSYPAQAVALLTHPHTGAWLAHMLKRIRSTSDDTATPLWADCCYLGWLAAAGSIACRTTGSLELVVRNGIVMLPRIGMAHLGDADHCGHCELRWTTTGALSFTSGDCTVEVLSPNVDSAPAWLTLRRVRGANDEPEVFLDDLDPFRNPDDRSDLPRLTPAQAHSWQQDFAAAWDLLRRDFGPYLTAMRSCLHTLTPLSVAPPAQATSHTLFTGSGCVYTTAPTDPCALALTLIHEIQHSKFGLLTDQIVLFDDDLTARFYAPWRDDPRPILGLLHGIYAFFGITDFWRIHRHSACHGSLQAHVNFELWRVQVEGAIAQAATSGLLTTAGERFLDGLVACIRSWHDEEVPAAAKVAAAEVSDAHRTFWHVRNLRPDRDGVADLAAQWMSGAARPEVLPPAHLVDQATVPDNYRRLYLEAQLKVADRDVAEALYCPEQPRGDRAYLAGDQSRAVAHYQEELDIDPLRPQLWAGLALALPKLYPNKDFSILSDRADVAAWLYQTLRVGVGDLEIVDLVGWLSKGDRIR